MWNFSVRRRVPSAKPIRQVLCQCCPVPYMAKRRLCLNGHRATELTPQTLKCAGADMQLGNAKTAYLRARGSSCMWLRPRRFMSPALQLR